MRALAVNVALTVALVLLAWWLSRPKRAPVDQARLSDRWRADHETREGKR